MRETGATRRAVRATVLVRCARGPRMGRGRIARIAALALAMGCSAEHGPRVKKPATALAANAGMDSLNARLMRAYHDRDPRAYAALFTDSAQFEWAAVPTVRGRAGLESMAREAWPALADLELVVKAGSRRIAADHATEFGAFEESWRDSTGARMTEYGRYVALLDRQSDDSWRMDRFFGFEDSTRRAAPSAKQP